MIETPPHGTLVLVGRYSWSYRKTIKIRFRQDAVPGTAKSRGGSGYFRYPRTTQERSSGYIADDDDYALFPAYKIRPLTKVRDLPHAWDDIVRGGLRKHTSWKLHRSHQYKPKPIGSEGLGPLESLLV